MFEDLAFKYPEEFRERYNSEIEVVYPDRRNENVLAGDDFLTEDEINQEATAKPIFRERKRGGDQKASSGFLSSLGIDLSDLQIQITERRR